MWVRTLSKRFLSLLAVALLSTVTVWGFPQFTTRENAIHLAEILEDSRFRDLKVESVFVKNRTEDEYYLQALLEDGSSRDWLLDRIYEWTLTDQLRLVGNTVLIFPFPDSTEFNVFNKNQFYQQALTSQIYLKRFAEHDILEGRSLPLGIRRFRLLEPGEESRFATDRFGHRYRYVLEMENGMREILTYPMAYDILQRGDLIERLEPDQSVYRRTYKVRDMVALPRQLEDEIRSIYRFGVEVFFDRPVTLSQSLFPFQIVEQNLRDPETGMRRNQFYVQIVFPNTEKIRDVPGFRTLEYLRFVEITTDVEHQQRVFLRAQVNPDIFELPPYVEITDRNSVIVYFFSVTDQSVTRYQQPVDDTVSVDLPRSVVRMRGEESAFEQLYLRAVEQIRAAQRQQDAHLKIQTYIASLDTLQEASLSATSDAQVSQSLKQRDVLLRMLPELIINNTQRKVLEATSRNEQLPDDLRFELLRHLLVAARFAPLPQHRRKVETLQNILR